MCVGQYSNYFIVEGFRVLKYGFEQVEQDFIEDSGQGVRRKKENLRYSPCFNKMLRPAGFPKEILSIWMQKGSCCPFPKGKKK